MGVFTIKVKPPTTGYLQLRNYIVGPAKYEFINTEQITIFERCNILQWLTDEVLESTNSMTEILDLIKLDDPSIFDVYKEVFDVEASEACTLGEMSLGVPLITYPVQNSITFDPVFRSNCNSIFLPGAYSGEHEFTSWVISNDKYMLSRIFRSKEDHFNLTSISINELPTGVPLYVRAQHGSGRYKSRWSDPVGFTVSGPAIVTPSIVYPENNSTGVNRLATITSSDYEPYLNSLPLIKSEWEVSTESGFQNVIRSGYKTLSDMRSFDVDPKLRSDTDHWVRVRYFSLDFVSPWSEGHKFRVQIY